MDFLDIAKTVGAGVISTVVPGGPAILAGINAILPDEHKLSDNVTGTQAVQAMKDMPPELRTEVALKQFDVELTSIQESNETLRAMLASEATAPQTTRPRIAWGAFQVVGFVSVLMSGILAYAVLFGTPEMVGVVGESWGLALAITGPFVTLLYAYFGILRQEQKNKLDAVNGVSNPAGVVGLLSTLMGRK